jgi:DNA processing protein
MSAAEHDERGRFFTDEEKCQWLRLLRSENVGPITFFQLLKRFKDVETCLKRLPEVARAAGRYEPLKIPSPDEVRAEYDAYQKAGVHLVAYSEVGYPPSLRDISDAPPLLSALGDLEFAQKPLFSIVGARNVSIAGQKLAGEFAGALSARGFVIVSGLARGVDTEAHTKSLERGTIAVLAGGVQHIYPPENKDLYHHIAEKGLLLSESALDTAPQANLFPRRNRLIAALSWGTLVVEAAPRSGSLITARYAADYGRDVFAIPGNPLDPRSQGTNTLIQEGAFLCQKPDEILTFYEQKSSHVAEASGEVYRVEEEVIEDKDIERVRLLLEKKLSTAPISINAIVTTLMLPTSIVRAALVELVLAGKAEYLGGDRIALLPNT